MTFEECKQHAVKSRYQNLLHVTVDYNKYTVKEFFKIVEQEGIDINPDDLLKDPEFNDEFNQRLVQDAKTKLYPFREMAKLEPDPVEVVEKEEPKKEPLRWRLSQFFYPLFDAPRRMACGMKPFDLPEKKKAETEHPEEDKPEESVKTELMVIPQPQEPKQVFIPAPGVANVDVQRNFNEILGLIKDRVKKGTIINIAYNNVAGSYTATVTLPEDMTEHITLRDRIAGNLQKTNCFSVDAKTFLPDYYSILVTDEKYGTFAVPFDHPVATNIINTPMYKVEPAIVEDIIKKYYFSDIGVYYTFDFSSIKGIDKMGKKTKKKFEKILTELAESLRDKQVNDIPRFRFSKFKSVDDFQITSDSLCRSPLAHVNETSGWIANCVFDVKNGKPFQLNANVVQQMTA